MTRPLLPSLGLALAIRAAVFFVALPDPQRFFTLDAVQYMALARDLPSGYFEPTSALWPIGLSRTPVYPFFAGALTALGGGSVVPVIVAQIGLSLAAVLLTYVLAARLLGPRATPHCALMMALDPATAIYCCLLQPESLFTVLVVLGLLSWLKALETSARGHAVAAGLLTGLAVLCRPIGLFLPIPFGVVAAFSAGRSRLRLGTMAFAAFLFPVGGWMVRNAIYTGVPLLSTIEGENLLNYRAAGALAEDGGQGLDEARARLAIELRERGDASGNPAETSRAKSRLAFEVLRQHPWGALRSAAAGMLHLAAGNGMTLLSTLRGDPEPERIDGPGEGALQIFLSALLALWYLGAALAVRDLWRLKEWGALIVCGAFILYFLLISAGPEANTRFRVPITPFLAVLTGFGFSRRPFLSSRLPPG